ncbi:MAG: hypothetical protein ACE5FI_18880 [Anaerolineales bacterium]
MDYGMIGKIEKAKRYAEQRERFSFNQLKVNFHGENNDHAVAFEDGAWQCDCEFFALRQRCSHTIALETLLEDMLPVEQAAVV